MALSRCGCVSFSAFSRIAFAFFSYAATTFSAAFIDAAEAIRQGESLAYHRYAEMHQREPLAVRLPEGIAPDRVSYETGDAMDLRDDLGAFDLVHAHVFHTAFHGAHPPVVMSAGAPLAWLYRDAWGWGPTRLRMATAFDGTVARWSGASMGTHHKGQARRFVSPSRFLRDWLVATGWPADRGDVVPNYCADPLADLPTGAGWARPRSTVPTIGFVAKDFDAKGGDLVVQAHARLRARHPDLRLVIVGSAPRLPEAELAARGISWTAVVPRQELLDRVLPHLDVLAHPSGVDALPYSVMEALGRGIPALVSDHTSLPEMVEDGAGVAVPRTVEAVTEGLDRLLSPAVWAAASLAARAHFEHRFSARTQARALGQAYSAALSQSAVQ